MPAAPRKQNPPPKYTGGYKLIDKHTYRRMVEWFRNHEGQAYLFRDCGRACGVSEPTAKKAYLEGLTRSGPECETPIKSLLANERIQNTAVSTVLLAAKSSGAASPEVTPEQHAEIAAVLGPTAFDQVRAEVRRAVRTEMDICEVHRTLGLRSVRGAELLSKIMDDRIKAIAAKFGATTAPDGTLVPPVIGPDLGVEMRALEAMGRTVAKAGSIGRLAIEIERLRISDPDALRRRLDSVYGSELGPAPGADQPAETTEEGAAGEEDTTLAMDEVSTIEEWAGLRVIPGGLSKKDPAPPVPPPAAAPVGEASVPGE